MELVSSGLCQCKIIRMVRNRLISQEGPIGGGGLKSGSTLVLQVSFGGFNRLPSGLIMCYHLKKAKFSNTVYFTQTKGIGPVICKNNETIKIFYLTEDFCFLFIVSTSSSVQRDVHSKNLLLNQCQLMLAEYGLS